MIHRLRKLLKTRLEPGTSDYDRHTAEELDHYTRLYENASIDDHARLMEPVPEAWNEILRRSYAWQAEHTGHDITGHAITRLQARRGVRMLSLGCGPGGVEMVIAREAPQSQIVGIDLNEEVLAMGRRSAEGEGLNVTFQQADLNTLDLPPQDFDLVFCHASLHHLVELERVFAQIRHTLRPGGELIVCDVITRNGFAMWPETRRVVESLWRTLPPQFRINHAAYPKPKVDQRIWQADTSASGMECIRSEDIVPLLEATFTRRAYTEYMAFTRRFLDPMYGPNYHLDRPLDRALLDWLWHLDCHYIQHARLRGESFLGVYGLE